MNSNSKNKCTFRIIYEKVNFRFIGGVVIWLLLLAGHAIGQKQKDSCWTVLLIKKGHALVVKPDMASLSESGFYLYRNCVYDIELKNKVYIDGQLLDILPGKLVFTRYYNEAVAKKAKARQDTITVPYTELDKIRYVIDRAMGVYQNQSFSSYDFIFKKDTDNCILKSHWEKIYYGDSGRYEIVPQLTGQGIGFLFEEYGATYFYYGPGLHRPDPAKRDTTYRKRYVLCFLPCNVEQINGAALGLFAKNVKNEIFNERDTLVINGLCVEINPFAIFTFIFSQPNGPYPDSINLYHQKLAKDWMVIVRGANINAIYTEREMRIYGLNITGVTTVVDEIHGVSISGINNFAYIMDGVSIALIRNRATVARGVQIGLFNKCTELHGIQIGLWNINGKRSLPIINWS